MKGLLAFFLFCGQLLATDITITWDPITEPGTAGYKIRYGRASGEYITEEYTGMGGVPEFTFTNLKPGIWFVMVLGYKVAEGHTFEEGIYVDGQLLDEIQISVPNPEPGLPSPMSLTAD